MATVKKSARGRKREIESKRSIDQQSNLMTKYLKREDEPPQKIAGSILNDLIECAVTQCEGKIKKVHHDVTSVSNSKYSEWICEYPWLTLEGSGTERVMKCKFCTECKVASVWAREGSTNFQKSSVSRHHASSEHQRAESKLLQQRSCAHNSQQEVDSAPVQVNDDEHKLFRTVFYAADEGLPTKQVNKQLDLQRINGAEIKYRQLSWDTLCEIQSCITKAIRDELVSEIVQSEFYSIMIDESTDLTVQKHLSICIKYVKNGEAVTKFLTNVNVEDGKAHTIVRHVVTALENHGLKPEKMVSLATDGAATMMGHKTGVGVQLKSKHSPFMVQTHCLAHRLNLAVVDSIKKNDTLVKFREKFNSLYHFMSSSSSRTSRLKSIQALLLEPELSIKEPHSIRWLGLQKAVEAVYEGYGSILATLSSFAADKNAQASGLYKYFATYKTVLLVSFMLDVHEIIGKLSKSLQKDTISFSEMQPLIDGTLESLAYLESKDGESLTGMRGCIEIKSEDGDTKASLCGETLKYYHGGVEEEFTSLRKEYISSLQKNIKHRFRKSDGDIFSELSVILEPRVSNEAEESEIQDALESLCDLYGEDKVTKMYKDGSQQETPVDKLLNSDGVKKEWPMLRGMLKGSYSKRDLKYVCKRVLTLHDSLMPEIVKLCRIALSIAVTSVICERSFSYQNRIKNKYRSSLKEESLDNLLQIQMYEKDFYEYDPTEAVKLWKLKKRRTGRLCQEYRPREKSKAASSKSKDC